MKPNQGPRDVNILLVDDDPDFLESMGQQLHAAGYGVISANSQKQAEALLADNRVNVAIVNLIMEHMDSGFVLCHHIKRKDPNIPVIMVTGVAAVTGIEFDASTDEERTWIKADSVLAKPVRFDQLQREIERLLHHYRKALHTAG